MYPIKFWFSGLFSIQQNRGTNDKSHLAKQQQNGCFSYILDLPFVCKICAFLPNKTLPKRHCIFYIFGTFQAYLLESKSMAHPSNSLANEGLGWDSLLKNIRSSWWVFLESCVVTMPFIPAVEEVAPRFKELVAHFWLI